MLVTKYSSSMYFFLADHCFSIALVHLDEAAHLAEARSIVQVPPLLLGQRDRFCWRALWPVWHAVPEGSGQVLDDGPHTNQEPALGSVHAQTLHRWGMHEILQFCICLYGQRQGPRRILEAVYCTLDGSDPAGPPNICHCLFGTVVKSWTFPTIKHWVLIAWTMWWTKEFSDTFLVINFGRFCDLSKSSVIKQKQPSQSHPFPQLITKHSSIKQ